MKDEGDVNLFAGEFQENPRSLFADLLERCPVAHSSAGDFYTVARYEDIARICRDPATWSSRHGPGLAFSPPEEPMALVNVDPPEHDVEVEIVSRAFSTKLIRSMEPDLRAFTISCLEAVAGSNACDLHAVLSVPLPLFAICRLLGVDYEDAEREGFREWVVRSAQGVLLDPSDETSPAEIVPAIERMYAYFTPRIEEWTRRLERGEASADDNLITRLLSAEHEGRRLPHDKILGFCRFLLVAGSATTTTVISSLVHRLLEKPERWAKLHSNRDLLPNAIEESLRYDAPVHGLFRTNTKPVELGPYSLPPETKVMLLWGAANVDPEVWERPEEFDMERDRATLRRHMAFGYGIHLCLGAALARLETTVAMEELLDRIPNPRLAGPVPLSVPNVLGGFDSLPIAWD